jgi:hypothetical protein
VSNPEAILTALYLAVDELNQQLPAGRRLEKSPATPIVGEAAALDSLGFLNLVLLAEARVNESCSPSVSLAEHLLEDPEGDPPTTLAALASLIAKLQGSEP